LTNQKPATLVPIVNKVQIVEQSSPRKTKLRPARIIKEEKDNKSIVFTEGDPSFLEQIINHSASNRNTLMDFALQLP